MTYSQKPLIELMKTGKFPDESGVPKHIETVISNVFIFENKVYKFYKNDNEFFNKDFRDLSTRVSRFSFSKRDFEWNNALSPSIYTNLIGVVVRGNKIEIVESENKAEELVFVMNRADTTNVLFEKLVSGEVTVEDCYSIGKQFGENMKRVQKSLSDGNNLHHMFKDRILDLRNWIKSVTEHISEEESDMYCDHLEDFRSKNKELFESRLTSEITTDGDFHSHNAIFSNGTLFFMDTFPPKEEWGKGHLHIPFYRIGTDILALSGDVNMFESFKKGYEEITGRVVDRNLDHFFVVYASGIAVPYLYMLQKTDPSKKAPAEKFHEFFRDYFSQIKNKNK